VVFSQSMFGSTIKLIGSEFARFGVESTVVPQTDVDAWRQAIRPNTRLLFAETPTNPLTDVCDIAALAAMARDQGAWLAVDNCFATPVLQRPLAMGADIVMHSGTKYLDGQGRVMAGALCATEVMVRERFCRYQERRHGALALQCLGRAQGPGDPGYPHARPVKRRRWNWRSGWNSTPRCSGCTTRAAKPPAARPGHAPDERPGWRRAVLRPVRTPAADEARERAFHVLDSLQVLSLATNLGDTKTLACHPASTSHGKLTEAQRQAAGIGQGLVRLAVGLEHVGDLQGRSGAWLCGAVKPWRASMAQASIRTRIAPSPTGFMHLGTARTALFSWAFARAISAAISSCASKIPIVARSTQEPQWTRSFLPPWQWLEPGIRRGSVSTRCSAWSATSTVIAADGGRMARPIHCYMGMSDELDDDARGADAHAKDKPRYDGTLAPRAGQGATLAEPPAGVPAGGAFSQSARW
jgi:O-succinylhomoserine sulfhydrylase